MSKPLKVLPEKPAERHARIRTEASRETVESIVVAIVLALLFRAFVAEAFVIPTGSMAPTLMGAHKDLVCHECGESYRTGASIEKRSATQETTVVASICPNCRYVNPLDLVNGPNDKTFAGDRILVSKFAYALAEPQRWDVIVFKFPGNPKQNYIKRLVGLPEETLKIRFGDVYSRPAGSEAFEILRKPHDKLLAMSQQVYDTSHQSATLIHAEYPARWQAWDAAATAPPEDSWQVQRDTAGMTATLPAGNDSVRYLRYFHNWPTDELWEAASHGLSLAQINPYASSAITDFYAYDAYVHVPSYEVYSEPPTTAPRGRGIFSRLRNLVSSHSGILSSDYQPGMGPEQFGGVAEVGLSPGAREGGHWVGDLIVEADVETEGDQGEIVLELVESAVLYRCRIDLADGQATLEIVNRDTPVTFAQAGGTAEESPTAATAVRGNSRHNLRFANCDDQLYLWVDDSVVEFDLPTTFDTSALRSLTEQRPHISEQHPFDAAPAALGVRSAAATVHRMQLLRDKYYIATKNATFQGLFDYDLSKIPLQDRAGGLEAVQNTLLEPAEWDASGIWDARREVEFELAEDQFFPMGDNSPESQDARCWVRPFNDSYLNPATPYPDAYLWADATYVPRDLLVGKALMVFWPHPWNTPIPFTPNFKRIGLIR